MRLAAWAFGGLLLGLAAAAGHAASAINWPPQSYNPKPLDDDLVLPMPCGGGMVFRTIAVPAKDLLDDRRFPAGDLDKANAFKENQRADYIAASFTDNHGSRAYYLAKYEVTRRQYAALAAIAARPTTRPRCRRLRSPG